MNLSKLTNENMIILKSDLTNKDEILTKMVDVLFENGKISSKEDFLAAIYDRESISETGIEGGLAIPHGKADCVIEPAFVVMTTQNVVPEWGSLDPDNEVRNIIMLAIPKAQGNSTHLDVLAALMEKMCDEEFTSKMFNSSSPKELYASLSEQNEETAQEIKQEIEYTKTIVAVTACPAGIAHTYMSATALEKAGDELGVKVYVEKQGANGVEDRHTNERLANADAAIFAVEVAVKEPERFSHLAITKVPVAEPIRNGKKVIEDALKKAETHVKGEVSSVQEDEKAESFAHIVKQSVLTGISYMIPIIVAGGLIGAFAVMVSNAFGLQELYATEGSWLYLFRTLSSNLLGTLLVPVLAAYMAYSIGDKTALVSGFAAGLAANMISGGFLVGMLGGLIAGFVTKYMKKYIPAKGTFSGFISFLIYPVLSTLIVSTLIFTVVGQPVAWLNSAMIDALGALGGTNAALLGAFIGIMVSFDLGGPINKAAYAFCIGAMAEGVLAPYAIFASVKMVSGFAISMATAVGRKKYSEQEIETGKTTWLLALGGITEGAIPFMMADPVRVIVALCTGSAVTGAIVAVAGVGLDVPGAGIFSIFMLSDVEPLFGAAVWVGAAVVGAIISAILLVVFRSRKLKKEQINAQ
ncbi:MAG: PTS 2-O-a-mannosyl-D-glycerate transporter subunit IIABC [Clostridia bacterium]